MDSPDKVHATTSCPEEHIRPPGTDHQGREFYAPQNQQAKEIAYLKHRCHELGIERDRIQEKSRELSTQFQKRVQADGKIIQTLKHLLSDSPSYQDSLEAHIREKHKEILSLNENLQSLNSTVAELQMICREHESCAIPKSAKLEDYAQHSAICGSYADESATPSLLNTALCCAKAAVTTFQRAFAEAVKHDCDSASLLDLLKPDAYFAKSSHINFAVRAAVYEVFFEGFENESFNTCSGVSRFLDPGVRQDMFYTYYLREKQSHSSDLRDPQFEAFCEMKVPRLWEKFNLRLEKNDTSMQLASLEVLGGSQLVSSFQQAAMNVWLLHKLAFSFEPPASIFRVEQGAGVDLDYMEPVVNLEDSKRFVNMVGFMIAPGLRIRKTVLRCEVYLSGGV